MNRAYESARLAPKSIDVSGLYGALARAQGEFPAIPKSKKGHGYMYAPLDVIQRLVRPVLAKHGICVVQFVDGEDVVTRIACDGATLDTRFPMKGLGGGARMNPMQEMGAQSTYAARYGYCLALGISADEDTDASDRGSAGPAVTEDFRDPRHDGMGTGVKGVTVSADATPAEKAKAFADGLIKQLSEAKTERGLSGVWSRNESIIDRLHESYSGLYGDVLSAYEARQASLKEEDAA